MNSEGYAPDLSMCATKQVTRVTGTGACCDFWRSPSRRRPLHGLPGVPQPFSGAPIVGSDQLCSIVLYCLTGAAVKELSGFVQSQGAGQRPSLGEFMSHLVQNIPVYGAFYAHGAHAD
jgi:hypothetical protein